jgi:hypothetical protein
MPKYIFIFYILFSVVNHTFGQSQSPVTTNSEGKVFFIGEDEQQYEKLVKNYNVLLFTVCENSMEKAYDNWATLMKEIENASEKANIDLKGVKLWLNVFWDKEGKIDYIVFYPKPNSRNLNYDLIKTFLSNFVKTYQSPLKYTTKFSHYGSVSFPIFSKVITEK